MTGTYLNITAEPGGTQVNLGNYLEDWNQKSLEIINVVCDTTLGTIAIQMPRIVDMRGMVNTEFLIVDKSKTADSNNITITMGGTDTFDNANTICIIDNEGGSVLFRQTLNDNSQTAGLWTALLAQQPFLPLFRNNATAGTVRTSLSAIAQAANRFYAGPASGAAAAPTFRALTGNDLSALWGQADLDFPNTAAQSSSDLFIAVAGAASGDVVLLGIPGVAIADNTCYTAFVSTSDQVRIRFNNYSSGAVNPASGIFTVAVIKYNP